MQSYFVTKIGSIRPIANMQFPVANDALICYSKIFAIAAVICYSKIFARAAVICYSKIYAIAYGMRLMF